MTCSCEQKTTKSVVKRKNDVEKTESTAKINGGNSQWSVRIEQKTTKSVVKQTSSKRKRKNNQHTSEKRTSVKDWFEKRWEGVQNSNTILKKKNRECQLIEGNEKQNRIGLPTNKLERENNRGLQGRDKTKIKKEKLSTETAEWSSMNPISR